MARKLTLAVLVCAALAMLAWWGLRADDVATDPVASVGDASPRGDAPPSTAAGDGGQRPVSSDASTPRADDDAASDAASRDAVRSRILDALAQRAQAARREPAPAAAAPDDSDEAPPSYRELTDRIGDRPYLTRVLSAEIMPLVDECVGAARERGAELGGTLAVGIEIVADPEEGGIVETAAASERNEVADPQLLECVRESMLSAILPAPEQGGREALEITIRTGDDED